MKLNDWIEQVSLQYGGPDINSEPEDIDYIRSLSIGRNPRIAKVYRLNSGKWKFSIRIVITRNTSFKDCEPVLSGTYANSLLEFENKELAMLCADIKASEMGYSFNKIGHVV